MPDVPNQVYIFAKFVTVAKQTMVLVIDNEFNIVVLDLQKEKVVFKENMLERSQIFETNPNHGKHKESITLYKGSSLLHDKSEKHSDQIL